MTVAVSGAPIALCSIEYASASATVRLAEWLLCVLGGLLIVGGVVGNSVTAYLQATERSHRGTTRFLMVFLALADCAVLLLAVTRYWIIETFGLDIRDLHPAVCRLHQAAVATVSDLAVYTLCALGVERFLLVAFPHTVARLITGRSFSVAFGLLSAGIAAKNLPIGFHRFTVSCVQILRAGPLTAETPQSLNWSQLGSPPYETYRLMPTRCTFDRSFGRWFAKLDIVTYLVLPYTILLLCNFYIYAAVRRRQALASTAAAAAAAAAAVEKSKNSKPKMLRRAAESSRNRESATRLLAVLTVIHICTTLPASVGQLLKVTNWLPRSDSARVTMDGLKTLMFANNATNFLAYFASCSGFRRRVLACLGGAWRRQQRRRLRSRLRRRMAIVEDPTELQSSAPRQPTTLPAAPSTSAARLLHSFVLVTAELPPAGASGAAGEADAERVAEAVYLGDGGEQEEADEGQ